MQDRQKTLNYILKIFEYIGKPPYLILLSLIFILSLIIGVSNRFFTQLNRLSERNRHKIKLPQLSFPSLPKLNLPSPNIPIKPNFKTGFKIVILLFFIGTGLTTYQIILKDLPHPQKLTNRHQPTTTHIFDRNHRLLYQIYQDENRSLVNLEDIPAHLVLATIAIEDSNFYNHPGFSLRGIARALKLNIVDQQRQGGSTITQQLVKNTLLTPERTFIRKTKELILSIAVESYYTKDEILSMYFNEVAYGGTAYGAQAASHQYFGKPVEELSLGQAALLAGLPAAPTLYSPFGANPQRAIDRQSSVLNRMTQEGFITPTQAQKALESPLNFINPATNIKAPHFVMYIRELLVEEFGESTVNQGGLNVVTSLDLDIQEMAESIVQEELLTSAALNINNAAVLITKPKSGEILAMVGSGDYFDTQNDGQVNVTTRARQPGSAIKPVTYSLALSEGFTPISIIQDTPITYHIPGSPPYSPRNYDFRFRGPVTVRQALANSYNIPAVKILEQIGVSRLVNFGREMGITTWEDSSRFGLALTLGAGEVKMTDMSVVYATLANYGNRVDLHPFISITNQENELLKNNPCLQNSGICQKPTSISPHVAYQITNILSDNTARSEAFGSHSALNIPNHQVAVKTGTSNSLRDNWAFGYTTDYVVSVWVGNNDNAPMNRVASGISGSSQIWNQVITKLTHEKPPHTFIPPSDLIAVQTCPLTGTLSCSACPRPQTEYFVPGTEPQYNCSNDLINQLLSLDTQSPPDTQ